MSCAGARRGPGGRDVLGDLRHEIFLARESALVPELLPELQPDALAVQIALEVEQEGFDAALAPAVVRIDSDRDRGAGAERLADVDPERRDEHMGLRREVRGRE